MAAESRVVHRARLSRNGSERDAGFLLPLSIGAALLLLLSSLSVQTAAVHGRMQLAAELRLRQRADALAAAAELVAARLSGPGACLLPLSYSEPPQLVGPRTWPGPLEGCTQHFEPLELLEAVDSADPRWRAYEVVGWRPGVAAGEPGELRLRLAPQLGEPRGGERRYALVVKRTAGAGSPLHVVGVRGLGR